MWALKKGVVVVTTGSKPERMAESIAVATTFAAAGPTGGPVAGATADAACGGPSVTPLSDDDVARIDEAGARLPYRKYWQKEFGAELDWQRPNHSLT